MADTFLVNLLLAFIVGSIWVTIATIIAEKHGSKLGGLIGGLPSTIVVSFFFIGVSQSAQVVSKAASAFPLAYSVTGIFLVAYALLAVKSFTKAILGALITWFILSAIVVILDIQNLAITLTLYLLALFVIYYVLAKKLSLKAAGGRKIRYGAFDIAWRAIFSGLVIAFAVFMAKFGGPIFGSIFSAFPAQFIAILFITNRTRGLQFSRDMTSSLAMSGLIGVVAYAVAAGYLYPSIGIIQGTVISYLIALVLVLVTNVCIIGRKSQ